MARYTHKYKFITSQPDKNEEYYVYRFQKSKDKEKEHVVVYKMKGIRMYPIYGFTVGKNDYKGFKIAQETIEERKFM